MNDPDATVLLTEELPNADATNNAQPTPLPMFQLFIVFSVRLVEPITTMVNDSSVNQFIRDIGVVKGHELDILLGVHPDRPSYLI